MSKILYDPIVSELESQYEQSNSNLGLKIVAEEENLIFHSRSSMINKKVLELGCGIYAASCGIKDEDMPSEYQATDFDKNLIEIAKKQDKRIKTSIINLHNLNEKIISQFGQTTSTELMWKSDTNIEVNKDTAEKLFRLLNSLEDNEDVQGVSSNFDVSEEILASLT